ncbi:MAG: hypothetical protein ACM3TS_00115 [Clostridia bacterium]
MIGETIRRLAIELDTKMRDTQIGESCFPYEFYKTYPFDVANFHQIEGTRCGRKISFVDGGNQEILGGANISIQLNRVYFNIFNGRRRMESKRIPQHLEFISVTEATFSDDRPRYRTQILPVKAEFSHYLPVSQDLEFGMKDEGPHDISKIASMARRFAEWSISKQVVVEELSEGDILVMDGALWARYSNELKYSKECFSAAQYKNVIFTALAKTSRLITNSGISLLGAIRAMAYDGRVNGTWYYHPIAESHNTAEMFVLKLHEVSQRVYRYDIYSEQARKLSKEERMQIFTQILDNSSDLSFPGYPYGLIDADYNARIRGEEVEVYKMILYSEISRRGSWPKFLREIQALDAHDALDFIKGRSL